MAEDESFIEDLKEDFHNNNKTKEAPCPAFTFALMLFHCYVFDRKKLVAQIDVFHETYPELDTSKNGTTINGFTSKVRYATEAAANKLRALQEANAAKEARRVMRERKIKAQEAAEALAAAELLEEAEERQLEELQQQQSNDTLRLENCDGAVIPAGSDSKSEVQEQLSKSKESVSAAKKQKEAAKRRSLDMGQQEQAATAVLAEQKAAVEKKKAEEREKAKALMATQIQDAGDFELIVTENSWTKQKVDVSSVKSKEDPTVLFFHAPKCSPGLHTYAFIFA